MDLFFIMIGGFLGTICRYQAGEWLQAENGFPLSTLIINLLGCFLLGWLHSFSGRKTKRNPRLVLVLGTGFIGSFTTFSAFSIETVMLAESGHIWLAILYVVISISFGLLFTVAGKVFSEFFALTKSDAV
ncbi:fluoride efflux transporter CrcB [Peribacillus cavernae]|uniref:Fluoride-specific ion channel FluC n=1 Tax=Peribacillus cavernae TaxID=1674310 RepID=A0A433HE56_9BACI|nr:fluoride efflux transporter CrcB [Peribacillus cavernae]MDQ0219930.1 CrcB protein [Peribacillus cavernae]RUQ26591.1 fluoride efflux transporter CrcB [Peribacillus cavernae]